MEEMSGLATNMDEESVEKQLLNTNLAENYSDEKLLEIGRQCKYGFEIDKNSRSEWEMDMEDWIALAKQVRETKNFPWPDASNIKYPLLTTAAMQFSARAYPSLVPSDGKVVKSVVIGKDPTGEKLEKATRVSTYMSYQVMREMDTWEEDMDKMLMMLPIVGTMFKKTYYDKYEDKICSHIILPNKLIVNNWSQSLDDSERISEIIEMSPREVEERKRGKVFRDVELPSPIRPEDSSNVSVDDETTPYELIEQHTFLKLEDDKYAYPYIITFERNSGIVLRISPRYHPDDITLDEKDKVVKIKPYQVYTKFGFVPNPDGSFYDIGFGILLGPLNESVNTIVNQLVDAGSLNNLQAGFIGKGLRMKMGESAFRPGEWKPVSATGDDLRKQIVPLPSKDPSKVLLDLLQLLITSGKELASVAEIFVGKMPGQNTPATTTMASIEQGMKVFTAVYKRIYRSLLSEFKKIFKLNEMYLDPYHVVAVLDMEMNPEDFDEELYDICPGADPTAVSQTEKLLKAQGLVELMQMFGPMLNPIEVLSRVLEAQEQPNWQKLFAPQVLETGQVPPQPPDPKILAIQAKAETDQKKAAADIQKKQMEMELDGREKALQMQMDQQEHAQKMQMERESAQLKAASDLQMANIFAATERAKGQATLQNNQQAHEQKMAQQKELAKSKTQISKSGSSTPSPKSSKKASKS